MEKHGQSMLKEWPNQPVRWVNSRMGRAIAKPIKYLKTANQWGQTRLI